MRTMNQNTLPTTSQLSSATPWLLCKRSKRRISTTLKCTTNFSPSLKTTSVGLYLNKRFVGLISISFITSLIHFTCALLFAKVVVSVESLLSRTPGLALEFKQHYGASTPGEGDVEPHSMPRADSNDTFIHFPHQTNPQTYQQPRTLSFASSVPVTSIATVTPENYASSERDPLLVPVTASLSPPAVVNTRLTRDTEAQLLQDSQQSSSRVAKHYSPAILAVFYFTLFLVLFVGALGAAFYFGVLDLSFFEASR